MLLLAHSNTCRKRQTDNLQTELVLKSEQQECKFEGSFLRKRWISDLWHPLVLFRILTGFLCAYDTTSVLLKQMCRNIHREAKAEEVPKSLLECQCCADMSLLSWTGTVLIMKRMISLLLIQPGLPALQMGMWSLGLEPAGVKVSSVSGEKGCILHLSLTHQFCGNSASSN